MTTPLKILLTHPGTQYSYHLAAQLQRLGILHAFVTGLAISAEPGGRGKRKIWAGWQKFLANRTVQGLPSGKLYLLPACEIFALLRLRLKHHPESVFLQRNTWFQQLIPQYLINEADIIIGFDTSSHILADRCHKAGKLFVLDASIAHPVAKNEVFRGLASRFPVWKKELAPKNERYLTIEQEEIDKANHIVVASSYTRNTYLKQNVPDRKMTVNGYGTDLDFFSSKWKAQSSSKAGKSPQPLTFLFFGGLSARKGFPWLCEVWQRFYAFNPDARLMAAGYGYLPDGFVVPEGVVLLGSINPAERCSLFHGADVFLFPSFFEGFAQVIIEAMACGLPVVTTTNTAGPDIMPVAGEFGFIVEPGDDDALLMGLQFFAAHPDQIEPMGKAARSAVESYTWEAYGNRWHQLLQDMA